MSHVIDDILAIFEHQDGLLLTVCQFLLSHIGAHSEPQDHYSLNYSLFCVHVFWEGYKVLAGRQARWRRLDETMT